MTQPPIHTEAGNRFAPGNQAATAKRAWQPYGRRVEHWMAKPMEEITSYVKDGKLDADKLGKLSTLDAQIVARILQSVFNDDPGKEAERLISRIEGQPRASIDMNLEGTLGTYALTDEQRTAAAVALFDRARERAMGSPDGGSPGVESVQGATDPGA